MKRHLGIALLVILAISFITWEDREKEVMIIGTVVHVLTFFGHKTVAVINADHTNGRQAYVSDDYFGSFVPEVGKCVKIYVRVVYTKILVFRLSEEKFTNFLEYKGLAPCD